MCLNLVANLVWFGIETDSGSRDFSSPPKGSQVCDMIYADITYTKRIRCTLIVYWHFEIGGFFLHFTDFTVKIDGNRHSQRGTLVSRVCLNQDIGVVKPSLACWPYIWLLARTFHSFRTLFAAAKFTHVGVLWNAAHRRFTPRKLTLHWKITIFKRKYIFKRWTFHCHVSFRGGTAKIKDAKAELVVVQKIEVNIMCPQTCFVWCVQVPSYLDVYVLVLVFFLKVFGYVNVPLLNMHVEMDRQDLAIKMELRVDVHMGTQRTQDVCSSRALRGYGPEFLIKVVLKQNFQDS